MCSSTNARHFIQLSISFVTHGLILEPKKADISSLRRLFLFAAFGERHLSRRGLLKCLFHIFCDAFCDLLGSVLLFGGFLVCVVDFNIVVIVAGFSLHFFDVALFRFSLRGNFSQARFPAAFVAVPEDEHQNCLS